MSHTQLDHIKSEAQRLVDRNQYYSEPLPQGALEIFNQILTDDLDSVVEQAFAEGEAAGETRAYELAQDEITTLKENIADLEEELKKLRKRKAKDPFKGTTPEKLRRAFKIIDGALDDVFD